MASCIGSARNYSDDLDSGHLILHRRIDILLPATADDGEYSAARNHRCSSSRKWVFWDGMEAISAERLASPARRWHSSTRLVDMTKALRGE
jgi:hypothetical protein